MTTIYNWGTITISLNIDGVAGTVSTAVESIHSLSVLFEDLPQKKQPFFPAASRAPKTICAPVQAPKRGPEHRLQHFANEKLWNRRNRPAAV
jgi:hypothetical protein